MRLRLAALILTLALGLLAAPLAAEADPPGKIPPKCERESNPAIGFTPRAITLVSVNVRARVPEYSFLKGRWESGELLEILPPNTCLAILEKKMVGVVQIWYLVRYKGSASQMRRGWVWGGTEGSDSPRYIGGDTTPQPASSGGRTPWNFPFTPSPAYAQGDTHPQTTSSAGARPSTAAEEAAQESYVELPLVGWRISVTAGSIIVLFVIMVAGMVAKAVWDQTETGGRVLPSSIQLLRPLLISPITFSTFSAAIYVQQDRVNLSLTALLFAFQVGFMWQHILEKKLETGRGAV